MLGEFITNSLVLVLGYAYPAFECFKTIEKNRVEIGELRFWCQYWIIVAVLRILESIGDVFMAWLPMYSEAKLALFIYLWYPKTKGTGYIYDTLLKPFVSKHEPEIDKSFLEFRARAFDLAVYYWHNCTELGQLKFFELLDFIASPSKRSSQPSSELRNGTEPTDYSRRHAPPSAPPMPRSSYFSLFRRNKPPSDRRQPPPDRRQPPPPPSPRSYSSHRSNFHPSQPEPILVYPEDTSFLDESDYLEPGSDYNLHSARSKYKRYK